MELTFTPDSLCFGLLVRAAHDLNLVALELTLGVQLEAHIFDHKRPNVVAEPVSIEVTFEREAAFDPVCDDLREGLVEVAEDFHGELGLDLVGGDEIVESVCESNTETIIC